MTQVSRWTGLEAALLRMARRMTMQEFADQLGVSKRVITKWSNGGRSVRPSPEYQAILDELLHRCTNGERERFDRLLRERDRQRPEDAQRIRWCLVVDVSPGEVARMAQLELAVNAVLDGPFFADPV